jgi:hypothetical protein
MHRIAAIAIVSLAGALGSCSSDVEPVHAGLPGESTANIELPEVVVHKSPSCGCCEMWVEHMRAAGFRVAVVNSRNVDTIKRRTGVPADQASCHTAIAGDYFIEGHVPAEDVKRLLAERPAAKGLVVPGMVPGSPGMEQGGVSHPYSVLLVAEDGTVSEYARHGR